MTVVTWADLPISPEHADLLAEHAIRPFIAGLMGVRSVTTVDDLPAEFEWAGERAVPALLFPWRTPGGRELVQLRPDTPVEVPDEKRPRKYLWPKGCGSPIGIVREDDDGPVLLVEGTKQGLAAAGYVTSGAVYSIAGCRSWSKDGVPEVDLDVVEGRQVVVIFDADLDSNPDVWDAAKKLLRALEQEGAADVRFALLAAGGKAGLDDVLGKRPEDKRSAYMDRLIAGASAKLPPKPKARKADPVELGSQDRPPVAVNDDRLSVIDGITAALKARWDGRHLFTFGGVLARRDGGRLEPVTPPQFVDLVQHAVTTVAISPKGDMTYAEPTGTVMSAALARTWAYTQLDRVATVPFVRPDGTVCQAEGYDEPTKTYLVEPLAVTVPEDPSEDEVRSAVKLWCDEWLGDLMQSMDPASQANTLALMLTPLIRGLVPVAPLAVVNGLQMGVGKNLVADLLAILTTGATVLPLPWSGADEENRKVIGSAFRTGRELFVFDEAHVLEGAAMARALTAATYTDRILGVSTMAEFPNNVTWVSLGNNVQINGDMSRRVYVIRLAPEGANPQDRSVDSFRHPDLKGWTAEHRAELVAAGLTLVRAWFAAGKPSAAVGRRFGSFEAWGGMVGGVLEVAGVEGFLGNLQEWRSESDYDTRHWVEHFEWLAGSFAEGAEFTVAEVHSRMRRAGAEAVHPPRLEDHETSGYGRELGKAYGKVKGRSYDGFRLLQVARSRQNGNRWTLERPETDGTPESGGKGGSPKTSGTPESGSPKTSGPSESDGDSSRSHGGSSHSTDGRGSKGMAPATYEKKTTSTPHAARDTHKSQGAVGGTPSIPIHPLSAANGQVDSGEPETFGQDKPDARIGEPKVTGTKGDIVTTRPGWTPGPDPERSPAAAVLALAVETTPSKYGTCPDCDAVLVPVPPHDLWRACRVCHPSTFVR
jgi:hypothetical protein